MKALLSAEGLLEELTAAVVSEGIALLLLRGRIVRVVSVIIALAQLCAAVTTAHKQSLGRSAHQRLTELRRLR